MRTSTIVLLLLAVGGGVALLLPDPSPLSGIRRDEMKRELFFLASDEMKGRDVGSPQNEITTRYLAYRFESMGLEGPFDGSYLQNFELVQSSLGELNRLTVEVTEGLRNAELKTEFYPATLSASATASGALLFAGFGITAPEKQYDDYRGLDAAGQVVVVLNHEPAENDPQSDFEGLILSDYGREYHKILNAQKHGAKAILLAEDEANHEGGDFRRSAGRTWPAARRSRHQLQIRKDRIRIPAAYISPELAASLLQTGEGGIAELQQDWENGRRSDRRLSGRVTLVTDLESGVSQVSNVVGLLRGSDPELRDEVVIVGAHLDHVSGRNEQIIFNGADDNASGTVGLLEVAEAFAAWKRPPRRSLLFAHFNAEEKGLLGSYFYTESPLYPLAKTAAMLQMDMIGRNEEVSDPKDRRFRGLEIQTSDQNRDALNLLGATRSRDLRGVAERANREIGLQLHFRYDNHSIGLLRRSDQWPFLIAGIPVLFFHTGLHPDYHRPTDTADRINFEKMERIVRLVYLVARQAAEDDQRPLFVPFGRGQ